MTERMPIDMKVLMNHIYEYKKGVRQMVLFTMNKRYETFALQRLDHQNIPYVLHMCCNRQVRIRSIYISDAVSVWRPFD